MLTMPMAMPMTMRLCISHNQPTFVFCRSNININDALGDYALTLIDSLDTLAVSVLTYYPSRGTQQIQSMNDTRKLSVKTVQYYCLRLE